MTPPTPASAWNPDHLEKAIGYSAKVDKKQSHYFLACHSPVERIRDERLKRELSEEELYQRIMGRRTHARLPRSRPRRGRHGQVSPHPLAQTPLRL